MTGVVGKGDTPHYGLALCDLSASGRRRRKDLVAGAESNNHKNAAPLLIL
jgi:hypothetical protein